MFYKTHAYLFPMPLFCAPCTFAAAARGSTPVSNLLTDCVGIGVCFSK